jgi:hypothetical protein
MTKNNKINWQKQAQYFSQKYYGTQDLTTLKPHQLDKITNWITNTNPNTQAKQRGRKYSGNTYKKLKGIYN